MFGDVVVGGMQLNEYGQIVHEYFQNISDKFQNVKNEFIIMPNHVHGIIIIEPDDVGVIHVGAIHELPLRNASPSELKTQRRKMLLPKIVGWLKMNSAKHINKTRNMHGVPLWQRNYFEHIVRDKDDMNRIRQYIINNPVRWDEDENNPRNIKK